MSFLREEGLETLEGFDEEFDEYGLQDYEFTYRWYRSGREAMWAPNVQNLNIGKGERRPIHPKAARLFTGLTGLPINSNSILRGVE